jgi:arsenate reductase
LDKNEDPERKVNMDMKRMLFLCTHNSVRSQIAEAFLRVLFGDRYDVWSAGTKPTEVNPFAIMVMAEEGIELSSHYAKSVHSYTDYEFDSVVTMCSNIYQSCPYFNGAKNYIHEEFADPSLFQGTEQDIINQFRKVRDEIKAWIIQTFGHEYRMSLEGYWE